VKTIILPLILVFAVVGCGQKESASSSLPDSRATATNQVDASGVDRDLTGKWTGTWETKVPKDVTETMEVTLSKEGKQWKGECRFTLYGNKASNTREVSVDGGQVSFRCDLGDSEFRFSGRLADGQIKGTLEIFENNKKVATGTWTVTRAKK